MGKNNNTIQINGKRYDAQTGVLLVDVSTIKPAKKITPKALDPVKDPLMDIITREQPKPASGHKPQSSQTLMRHVVKKPADSLKRHTKAHSGKGAVAAHHSTTDIITKASVHKLDEARLKHAQKVAKSKLISRFLPVTNDTHAASQMTNMTPPTAKPIVASFAPTLGQAKTTADLLQQALQHATSHEQTYAPDKNKFHSSKRITGMSAIVATIVIIVGVIASHGLTAVRLHVASSKAGFSASVPSYQPAGYSLSKLSYSAGNVGLHFNSNSDNRAFSITEKTSSWDSSTLRDLVVAPAGNDYQTIESAGHTIFLDSKSNATWVNGGVLFQVDTGGVLNQQQLVKIANSL